MLVNFFNDHRLQENFTLSLSYRAGPVYVEGLRKRLKQQPREQGLALLNEEWLSDLVERLPRVLAVALRSLQSLLLLRYWILALNVIRLTQYWKTQQIDLLHINNGGYPGASSCRAAAIAARILRIPHTVMVVNNIATNPRLHERLVEKLISKLLGCSVQTFVTGSNSARLALKAQLPNSAASFLSLHNGIGSREPDETVTTTRQRLGMSVDTLVFAVVALHEPRKGHSVLIEALAKMNEQLTDGYRPTVLIEGTGPEEQRLRSLTVKLGMENQVLFIGREFNVFNLMQSADLLVVPSIANEDFPNVVLEAMSLGTPVLASSLAGISEQVEDDVSGWLVPPGDVAALSAAMLRLVLHPDLISAASLAARKRFRDNFTAKIAVDRYIQLYQDLSHMKKSK